MRALRTTVGATVVLSLFTLSVLAGTTLLKVQVKGDKYISGGETMVVIPLDTADFAFGCAGTNAQQVVALVNDAESNIVAFALVDSCGNILCTNLVVTTLCEQVATTSNGKTETDVIAAHDQFASPDAVYTGGGFLLTKGVANPTNSTAITGFTGKGDFVLCRTNNDVLAGTITIKGLFKPGKGCDD
jgi:hypothetical protein